MSEEHYGLDAGGVYRFQRLDSGRWGFVGGPEIVEIDAETAARCAFTGTVFYIDGEHVAEFEDEETGEHYGQPVEP